MEEDDTPEKASEEAVVAFDEVFIDTKASEIAELFREGFHWYDVFNAIGKLMEIAEALEGTSGGEKKAFVIACFKRAFALADPKYASWVPKWVSRPIVRCIVLSVVPHAIEWGIDWTSTKYGVN